MIPSDSPDYSLKKLLHSLNLCADLIEENHRKWQDAQPAAIELVFLYQSLQELDWTVGLFNAEKMRREINPVENILRCLFREIRKLQMEELDVIAKLALILRENHREIENDLRKHEEEKRAEKARKRAEKGFVVFLIEDDLPIRHLMRKTIEREQPQWKLLEASDGQEALDRREWLEEADVIVTDLEMPRMGGRELIDKLFRDPQLSRKPVIIFSGSSEGGLQEHWGKGHTLFFMDKSCHPKDLVERVKALAMAKGRA
jgi:CheY-like chemotaxis protein